MLLDAIVEAVIVTDVAGVVWYWNQAAERIYGWTSAEAMGRPVKDLAPAELSADEAGAILGSLRLGQTWSGDLRVRRRDGTWFPAHLTDTPVLGPDGELVAFIGASIDVTERRTRELEHRQMAAVVASSGDAIFSVSRGGTVASWNRAAEALLGYTARDAVGRQVTMLVPAAQLEDLPRLQARLDAGGPPEHFETTLIGRDGRRVAVAVTASGVIDETGQVVGRSVIARDLSDQRAARRALEASERLLTEAQRVAKLGSFEHDRVTGHVVWSAEMFRILGVEQGREPSRDLFVSLVHWSDIDAVTAAWARAAPGVPVDLSYRIVRPDSEVRWVHARSIVEAAPDGTPVRVVGTVRDDTERVASERSRREAEARFEIGFERSEIATVIFDLDSRALRVNGAACALLGRPADVLLGRRWVEYLHPDDPPRSDAAMMAFTAGNTHYHDELRFVRPDGTVVWAAVNVTLVRGETVPYVFTQLRDITTQKHLEIELSHQALHDSLTGLPNRALLGDRLLHSLERCRLAKIGLAVIFMDLDEFKLVNDIVGHTCGDELLRCVAVRLAAAVPGGTVARFGGDEFIVVCEIECDDDATRLAKELSDVVRQPITVGGAAMTVTASVGIAVATADSTAESLISDADMAMYRAKDRGRDVIELYSESLRATIDQHIATISALDRALERSEFVVHYQPIVSMEETIVGVEALVRWRHPDRGLLPPAEFISVAEDNGLIVEIGAWVLKEACRQAAAWRSAHPTLADLHVAVNLSGRQFADDGLLALVRDALRDSGLPANALMLEVTESALMDDMGAAPGVLTALRDLGVGIYLDDFGTGYSSLLYLRRFPIGCLKVDRFFVSGISRHAADRAIVSSVISLGHALGMRVVAEGVESHDQLVALRDLGCDYAQGYYWSAPKGPQDLEASLLTFAPQRGREVLAGAAPTPRPSAPASDGVSVVLIDDSASSRSTTKEALQESGRFVVVGEARDGSEVATLIARTRPELVLLELSLPGSDGLEVLGQIRHLAPATRVVIVSGFVSGGIAQAAMAAGAAACIDKSVGTDRLVHRLSLVMGIDSDAPDARGDKTT